MAFMGYLSCKAALLESWWGNKDLKMHKMGRLCWGGAWRGKNLEVTTTNEKKGRDECLQWSLSSGHSVTTFRVFNGMQAPLKLSRWFI